MEVDTEMRESRPGSSAFRPRALVRWLAGCACLLLAGVGCNSLRMDCHACQVPDPLATGCPYDASKLAGPFVDPSVLLLSGGGSHGAWGAGVLVGWPPPRPQFTVVTGISSGALQATFAFLGTHDPELQQLFTTTENDDVYEPNWNALWSNSLQSREPLKEIIDENLDEGVIREVADVSGREVWVGTVNLDTSQFCPWNLSTIAKKAKEAWDAGNQPQGDCYRDLYRDVVWAASGAPVVAPPVPIDANACTSPSQPAEIALHVDGGARLRVFALDVLVPIIEAKPTMPVYVIMNGKLTTHPRCVADQLGPIAVRALQIADHEALFGSLYALSHKFGKPEMDWNLRLSRIPDERCVKFPTSEFDPDQLGPLFEAGKDWVSQSSDPWERTIPESSAAPWPDDCCSPLEGCPLTAGCVD